MKLLTLFTLSVLVMISGNTPAEACSPPPDSMYVQAPELQLIVGSSEIYTKLRTLGATRIQSIAANGGSFVVTATNGCFLTVTADWKAPTSNGMCPSLVGITVGEASCQRN